MTTAVKERPILFIPDMVKAIRDERKTNTRRVIYEAYRSRRKDGMKLEPSLLQRIGVGEACPYGAVGDRLWIKTGYKTRYDEARNQTNWSTDASFCTTHGRAFSKSGNAKKDGGHPGMFMPFWLSRELRLPTLEITDVRVERIKDINADGCIAEGVPSRGIERDGPCIASAIMYIEDFKKLWDGINEKRGYGWAANPWVWCIEFKRVELV